MTTEHGESIATGGAFEIPTVCVYAWRAWGGNLSSDLEPFRHFLSARPKKAHLLDDLLTLQFILITNAHFVPVKAECNSGNFNRSKDIDVYHSWSSNISTRSSTQDDIGH